MSYVSDTEIMGGVGFGFDEYPSSYDHHTDFSLLSNGSRTLNQDPYLPIENEPMGRKYDSSNFDSSYPSVKKYRYSPAKLANEPYEAITRANADTVSQVLNKTERLTSSPDAEANRACKANMAFDGQSMLMMFMIFIFVLLVILAYLQNLQMQKLYKIVKTIVKNKTGATSN
jgi:hypothetical protein